MLSVFLQTVSLSQKTRNASKMEEAPPAPCLCCRIIFANLFLSSSFCISNTYFMPAQKKNLTSASFWERKASHQNSDEISMLPRRRRSCSSLRTAFSWAVDPPRMYRHAAAGLCCCSGPFSKVKHVHLLMMFHLLHARGTNQLFEFVESRVMQVKKLKRNLLLWEKQEKHEICCKNCWFFSPCEKIQIKRTPALRKCRARPHRSWLSWR